MALFIRSTKTRVWSAMGPVSVKKFIADKDEPAIEISLLDESGKTHSINLYGGEIDILKKALQ